jgi:SAM-dependent methyltransferase
MRECSEQVDFWKEESWNYFQRNYRGKNLREIPLLPIYLEKIFQTYPISIEGGSILDVGCSPGSNLFHLHHLLKTRRGVGTEPSPHVVDAMANAFPELEFYDYPSQALPFKTGEFDLVILRSVLCWVDRNYLLQSLGEATRVTSCYLLISDFSPPYRYSTIYSHQRQYRTYKMDYQMLMEACGFMGCVASFHYDDAHEWTSTKTALYKKIPLETAFPIRSESDFT